MTNGKDGALLRLYKYKIYKNAPNFRGVSIYRLIYFICNNSSRS